MRCVGVKLEKPAHPNFKSMGGSYERRERQHPVEGPTYEMSVILPLVGLDPSLKCSQSCILEAIPRRSGVQVFMTKSLLEDSRHSGMGSIMGQQWAL